MNLYKLNIVSHIDHTKLKSIEHVDNNYYYDNKHLLTDCMISNISDNENRGWAFCKEKSFYLIDIHTYNMEISEESFNNPQTIHEQFISELWTIRDNKINEIL